MEIHDIKQNLPLATILQHYNFTAQQSLHNFYKKASHKWECIKNKYVTGAVKNILLLSSENQQN